MPELPEVEVTRRGIKPHILNQQVSTVTVRDRRLRWPVPTDLPQLLSGQSIHTVERRAKYLLLRMTNGTLLIHLGMSGSLRVLDLSVVPQKHDHVDIVLGSGCLLRYHDPRRFGCVLWLRDDPAQHKLLKDLGPEPLSAEFHTDYLFGASRGRSVAVKNFIMNGRVVVGVGNIYANEALYGAGIDPRRAAGRISRPRYGRVVQQIKQVLADAVDQGGTTLKDFVGADGRPGHFTQQLAVYDREGQPCLECGGTLVATQLGQRQTVFCRQCQR